MKKSIPHFISIAAFWLVALSVGYGFQQPRVIAGQYDNQFGFPAKVAASGQKDAAAVQWIKRYLSIVSQGEWRGLTVRGSLVLGQDEQAKHEATITLDPAGRSRLDFSTGRGTRSIRMNNGVGGVVLEDGHVSRYPASVSEAGLFVTPFALKDALENESASLIDDGVVTVETARFRKITYSRPMVRSASGQPVSSLILPLVIDLYFDPASHLLVKTVDGVHLSSGEKHSHLRVITFGDYRSLQGAESPFSYQETLDGQLSWRLTADEVQAGSTRDASFFSF
jgi:hypothetical protein